MVTMKGPIFIDEETGECFDIEDQLQVSNNVETGEPEANVDTKRLRRKIPFQVNLPFVYILIFCEKSLSNCLIVF